MATDNTLNLMPFLQRWSGNTLDFSILLLPKGNPTAKDFYEQSAPFAGTTLTVTCYLQNGVGAFVKDFPDTKTIEFTLTPPTGALARFEELGKQMDVKPDPDIKSKRRPLRASGKDGDVFVKKALSPSYLAASGAPPRPDLVERGLILSQQDYACRLRRPHASTVTPPDEGAMMTWGKVISYALMQPALSRQLGLLYDGLTVTESMLGAPVHECFANGGWLAVELQSPGLSNGKQACLFRTYVPPLKAGEDHERPLFSAVLFPETTDGAGIDEAMQEAVEFDDGFASIVHASHPRVGDAIGVQDQPMTPGAEAGIRLGWDDEHVLVWTNRQLEAYSKVQDTNAKPPASTLGVSGYRIDVREVIEEVDNAMPPDQPWASLFFARANKGNERARATGVDEATEFGVSVPPLRQMTDEELTLASYFATWRGGSLSGPDPTARWVTAMARLGPNGAVPPEPEPMAWTPVTDEIIDSAGGVVSAAVPALRYGRKYEFRVRYRDLTGSGPQPTDEPINPAAASEATIRFQRTVRPKAFAIKEKSGSDEQGSALKSITLERPLLDYPDFMYTGLTAEQLEDLKITYLDELANGKSPRFALTDPDVTHIAVSIGVRVVLGDSGNPLPREGEFLEVHRAIIETKNAGDLTFKVEYDEVKDVFKDGIGVVFDVDSESAETTIHVPASRDVRLTFWPVCDATRSPRYFDGEVVVESDGVDANAPESLVYGLPAHVHVRKDVALQPTVLNLSADQRFYNATAMLIGAHADAPLQLLASALNLDTPPGAEASLCAREGDRVVFGASDQLRHTLSNGNGRIQFASLNEIKGRWIVVVEADWDYDWTWDGASEESFKVQERVRFLKGWRWVTKGTVTMPLAVDEARCGASPEAERGRTRVLFFHAVTPRQVDATKEVPTEEIAQTHSWRLFPCGKAIAGAISATVPPEVSPTPEGLDLPIAVPPDFIPKVVAAGIAHGQAEPDADYAALEAPSKVLWLEFEKELPVSQSQPERGLKYFVRVLGHGPDPLLAPITALSPVDKDEPEIPLDAEDIRVIRAGQPHDESGYVAMQEMVPEEFPKTDSEEVMAKRWIVPLPPGLSRDAPQLFDFWTYEIRAGFDRKMWTTAQARFGRPMRLAGVQHPPPAIAPLVFRETQPRKRVGIKAEAAVFGGLQVVTRLVEELEVRKAAPSTGYGAFSPTGVLRKVDHKMLDEELDKAIAVKPDDLVEVNIGRRDIVVEAPFAFCVGDGGPLNYESLSVNTTYSGAVDSQITRLPMYPRTRLWALLYAQVRQADNGRNRNVLLLRTPMYFAGDPRGSTKDIGEWFGRGAFSDKEVVSALRSVGLNPDAANLSVMVVELLPNPKTDDDPMGANLGNKRILRTSGLIPVTLTCERETV